MIGYKLFWLVAVYWYSYSTLKKSNGDFRCYGHRTTQMVNLYIQKVSALTLYVNFVFSSVSSSCFCCPEYQCICIYNVALVRCLRTNEFCKIKTHMPSLRCGQPQQNIRWDSFLSRLTGNATSTFVISLCYNIFSLFDVLLNTSKQTSYTYSIVHLVNKNCVFQWHTAKETSCHKTIAVTSSFFPGESSRDPTKASFFFFLTHKQNWLKTTRLCLPIPKSTLNKNVLSGLQTRAVSLLLWFDSAVSKILGKYTYPFIWVQ